MKLRDAIGGAAFMLTLVTFLYVLFQSPPQEPYFTLVTLGFIASMMIFVWAIGMK